MRGSGMNGNHLGLGAWDEFWKLYSERDEYAAVEDARAALANGCEITQGSVFELEARAEGAWDVGTMFFVAESITQSRREFRKALIRFLDSLASGAPFAIALMEHSLGYQRGRCGLPGPPTSATTRYTSACVPELQRSVSNT